MLSFLILYILANKVVGQGASLPDTSLPITSASGPNTGVKGCSACYGVAPIDQIITGVGASFSVGLGEFTWNLAEVFSAQTDAPTLVALPTASVITYNGQPIGDPTIYNVFTSYSIIALHEPNGTCVATTLLYGEVGLPLSLQIPSGTTSNIVPQAESSFIKYFNTLSGGLSCVTISSTVAITTTVTISTTGLRRPSLLPESAASSTTFVPLPTAVTETLNISVIFSSTSSGSNATIPTGATTLVSNSSSITPTESSGASGLSLPAKLGVGIGVGVGGAIILVIIGTVFLRRSTRKTGSAASQPVVELSSKRPDSQAELESKLVPQELEHGQSPRELENQDFPQELSNEQRTVN